MASVPGDAAPAGNGVDSDWSVLPLGDCLLESPAYGINAAAVPYHGELPTYIRITDIDDEGRFSPEPRVSVRHPDADHFFLSEGDLVFARTGASVGKSYRYRPGDGPLVYAGFLIRITPNPKRLLPEYLAYYAQTKQYWDWVASVSRRTGQPGINAAEYATLPVLLPPIGEQRAIVDALGQADDLSGRLFELISKKKDIKLATRQELLTGKTRLPGFNGSWDQAAFGRLTSIRNERVSPAKVPPRTPCVELKHMRQAAGGLQAIEEARHSTSTKYVFRKGDVLFGRLRPYLRKYWLADREGVCSTEIWPLMIDSSHVDTTYLYYLIQTQRFIDAASISYGTHMPRADWEVLRSLEVEVPPLAEQRAIANVLSDMDSEIAVLEEERNKVMAIKKGMMQELLTGRTRLNSPTSKLATVP